MGVKLQSLLKPNLRYVVPNHYIRTALTDAQVKKLEKDSPDVARDLVSYDDDGKAFIDESGPNIVQFVDGKAEVADETWAAMEHNGVAAGLGVARA